MQVLNRTEVAALGGQSEFDGPCTSYPNDHLRDLEALEMPVTTPPDPIVDPERLFEGLENLMLVRAQNPFLGVRKIKQCHPERSECFAKRSRCGVEGPLISVGRDECGRRSHKAARESSLRRRCQVQDHGVLRLRVCSLCERPLRSG
jgi:hypothetical protein